MIEYKSLQNGSDIRGVALATSDGPEVNLTEKVAERIALGFLIFLQNRLGKSIGSLRISVGRDSRITGPLLLDTVSSALAERGAFVMNAGLASTPAMFMSTVFQEFSCDGAIMITASHMPPNRNGLKFFTRAGGLEKTDISEILKEAESDDLFSKVSDSKVRSSGESGNGLSRDAHTVHKIPLMDRYCQHLRDIIKAGISGKIDVSNPDSPLQGMRITVDAGNGAGGFYAEKVLAPLGADISTSQFLEPDGYFPNHIPNPESKEAMNSICTRVKECGTHLGLIFDTDVDRASAVDENGREIAHNGIVAMAAALIAQEHPGTTVVTDSVTSNELTDFLTNNLGLRHLRYKRGYRNVIGKAMELDASGTDSQLAIETSGHAAFKQNYYLDDGAYLATLIVIKAAELYSQGKGISTVISDLREPAESMEFRLPFSPEILRDKNINFSDSGDSIISALSYGASHSIKESSQEDKNPYDIPVSCTLVQPNYEGVRINFDDEDIQGWLLLRKSLHDPIMPLNIESRVSGGCKRIIEAILPLLSNFPELNISALRQL